MQELRFEQDLVRALLREQHPDLADLELRDVDGGWDNQQWRLGEELAVRLPRTERAPALLRTEQTWLPMLAARLPLPTPAPVRIGKPSSLFEHTWTIARWVEGEPADRAPITRIEAAEILAGFLRALHRPGARRRPGQPARGIPLAGLRGRRLVRRSSPTTRTPTRRGRCGRGRRGARLAGRAAVAAWRPASGERGRPGRDARRGDRLRRDVRRRSRDRSVGRLDPVARRRGESVLRRLWAGRRSHHHPGPRLGCPARPEPDRNRAERQARSARRQTDLGTGGYATLERALAA